jgi:hypothetical protein
MTLLKSFSEDELTDDSRLKLKIARYLIRRALISESSLQNGYGEGNTATMTIVEKVIFDGKKWRKP